MLSFDLYGEAKNYLIENTPEYVLGLEFATVDKVDRCFTDVYASRSTVVSIGGGNIRHEHNVWKNKGPFSAEQIKQIVEYKPGMLNDEWFEHMKKSGGVNILLSSNK